MARVVAVDYNINSADPISGDLRFRPGVNYFVVRQHTSGTWFLEWDFDGQDENEWVPSEVKLGKVGCIGFFAPPNTVFRVRGASIGAGQCEIIITDIVPVDF